MARPPRPPPPPGFKLCAQCYTDQPIATFTNPKTGREVTWCAECRDRYRNWHKKTDAERIAARRPVQHTGDGYHVSISFESKNRKTGPIPVTMTDMMSCAERCPHRDAGCYASYGKMAAHWRRAGLVGLTWTAFCAEVEELPARQLWRHNEAGDLPGKGDVLDVRALALLVRANARANARGFTFTHKPLRSRREREAVRLANAAGFTINLSADSLKEADRLAAKGIGPVAVILPADASGRAGKTPAGRTVVVCPNETAGITCSRCQLCAKPDRQAIVGFRAHGQAKRIVSLRVIR